nr:MAG TPA: hypothetical protein [Caudoviricetes sp.]
MKISRFVNFQNFRVLSASIYPPKSFGWDAELRY